MNESDLRRVVSLQALARMLREQLTAMDLCLANRLPMQALILIYVLMDNMASLDRAPNHTAVKRSDFVRWADRYVIPDSGLSCSAVDLYGARCGILHTYSSESDLSRKGKVASILYAWGPRASEEELEELIDMHYGDHTLQAAPRAVHVERLAAAVRRGVASFIREVRNDKSREDLVLERARVTFSNLPADEL